MGRLKIFSILLFFIFIVPVFAIAGTGGPDLEDFPETDTDTVDDTVIYFFDLRDRETFLQLTHTGIDIRDDDNFDHNTNLTVHIQIFDVSRDCNENDFFDVYTPADTHVYNMRDIQTNDGSPSGVVLPDGAFGFVFGFAIDDLNTLNDEADVFIGNIRIIDDNGYEYRTNAATEDAGEGNLGDNNGELGYFNYNTSSGVTFSDIVGVVFDDTSSEIDIDVAPLNNFGVLNVDIFNLNETPFSCRNVIYACISPDSPLQDALLEKAAEEASQSASIARAEYGINDAIPHSKGGELLCPGNNISEGFVKLEVLNFDNMMDVDDTLDDIVIWIGLNNGNGRGSFDSNWIDSDVIPDPDGDSDDG